MTIFKASLAAFALALFLQIPALADNNYTCYATDADGNTFSSTGYGSEDRIQQDALSACKAETTVHGCRRAGCDLAVEAAESGL
jgi:hypothetical protein